MTSLTRVIRQLGVPDEDREDLDVIGPFAVMTAYVVGKTREENESQQGLLTEAAEDAGLTCYPLHGVWRVPDGDHTSPVTEGAVFLVPAGEDQTAFEDTVHTLMEKFNQTTALVSDGRTVWVDRSGAKQDLGDTFTETALEQAYHDMRAQPDTHTFTFAGSPMLSLSNEETAALARNLKKVAYAVLDREPEFADSVIAAARQIVGHTVSGNFPTGSLLRDTVRFFKHAGIQGAVIGGVAVAVHGQKRSTDDIDFLVDKLPDADLLRDRATMRGFGFYPGRSHTGKVLTLDHQQGQVEFLLADTPLRRLAVETANPTDVLGVTVPVVTPAALVALKVRAAQDPQRASKDKADALSVIESNPDMDTSIFEKLLTDPEKATLAWLLRGRG